MEFKNNFIYLYFHFDLELIPYLLLDILFLLIRYKYIGVSKIEGAIAITLIPYYPRSRAKGKVL